MNPSVWLGYILGRGDAIRSVAENRAAIWTGAALVLLTSIARNYDQTFVLEKPFLLLFGSLFFSLVSGTWLYCVVYASFVRRAAMDADCNKPSLWGRWPVFMGLFWMTAPVAWLYAIPVERFCDSLTAAKANLMLLGIVSLWRVLLITRVIQVLTGARYYAVLLWVLFAAAIEVLLVVFFGGGFARSIMAAMGGMRNSPEEALLFRALSAAFTYAFWGAPIFLLLALWMGHSQSVDDLPTPTRSEWPGGWLAIAAAVWVAIAIVPQIELSRSSRVERLISGQEFRAALDYLSAHNADQFAPARTLAPNAFEYEIFEQLPGCFGAIQAQDAPWVKAHLLRRLDEMISHYGPSHRATPLSSSSPEEQVRQIVNGLGHYGPNAKGLTQLLDGLNRTSEGTAWLAANPALIEGVRQALRQDNLRWDRARVEEQLDLLVLSNRLGTITQHVEAVVVPP